MTSTGMLSRLAESMFWIGRYAERADDTARITDAYLHRLLENPLEDESLACRSLVAIMGLDPGDHSLDLPGVMDLLAFDASSPSTIVGALTAARENAQGARDQISSEMWECLNSTWHDINHRRSQAARIGAHSFLRWVRERCALFAGLTDATMSRSDAWNFVLLGRCLERVDMTARLMAVRVTAGGLAPDWPTLLRAAGAEEAFIAAYGGNQDADAMADFLLRDRLFPRSAFRALLDAESCLTELSVARTRIGFSDPTQRIVGQMRTRLEYVDRTQLIDGLGELLEDISVACADASLSISATYFGSIHSIRWEPEG